MLFVSASANAISINGQAGEDYTNLGFGMGRETTGLAVSGNWMHNDDDGDVAGLGLGLNIPLGPLLATVGGKGVYTNPNATNINCLLFYFRMLIENYVVCLVFQPLFSDCCLDV